MNQIREKYRESEGSHIYSQKIVTFFNQFVHDKIRLIPELKCIQVLNLIIRWSMDTDKFNIFMKSSQIYHKLDHLAC